MWAKTDGDETTEKVCCESGEGLVRPVSDKDAPADGYLQLVAGLRPPAVQAGHPGQHRPLQGPGAGRRPVDAGSEGDHPRPRTDPRRDREGPVSLRPDGRRHPHGDRAAADGIDRTGRGQAPYGTEPERPGGARPAPVPARRARRARQNGAPVSTGAAGSGAPAPGRRNARLYASPAGAAGPLFAPSPCLRRNDGAGQGTGARSPHPRGRNAAGLRCAGRHKLSGGPRLRGSTARFFRRDAEQPGRGVRSGLCDRGARGAGDSDDASVPSERGTDSLVLAGIPVRRTAGRLLHGQQHDAAEEKSGRAGISPWQDRPRLRPFDGAADDAQGSAAQLQPGFAGR